MKRFDAVVTGAPLGLLAAAMLSLAGCGAPGDRPAAGEGGAAAAQAELPPEVLAGVEMMFSLFDRNQDGEISRADLESMGEGFSFTNWETGQASSGATAVEDFLDMFDLNDNGQVTRDEMIEAAHEMQARQQGSAPQP